MTSDDDGDLLEPSPDRSTALGAGKGPELDPDLSSAKPLEVAEEKREAAEEKREAAECARESDESLRQLAEGVRSDAEASRLAAEQTRRAAEQLRRNAEHVRQAAEIARAAAAASLGARNDIATASAALRDGLADQQRQLEDLKTKTAELQRKVVRSEDN